MLFCEPKPKSKQAEEQQGNTTTRVEGRTHDQFLSSGLVSYSLDDHWDNPSSLNTERLMVDSGEESGDGSRVTGDRNVLQARSRNCQLHPHVLSLIAKGNHDEMRRGRKKSTTTHSRVIIRKQLVQELLCPQSLLRTLFFIGRTPKFILFGEGLVKGEFGYRYQTGRDAIRREIGARRSGSVMRAARKGNLR